MSTADDTLDEHDWNSIKKTLRDAPSVVRGQFLLRLVVLIAAIPLIAQADGTETTFVMRVLSYLIPMLLLVRLLLAGRTARHMTWLGTRSVDFFEHYRALVRRQQRALWFTIVALPLWAVVMNLVWWYVGGPGDENTRWCRVLLVIVTSLLSVWHYSVPLASLRRVRAQLS